MQKWEYLFVAPCSVLTDGGYITVPSINGQAVDPPYQNWMIANKLGAEGWELIAATGVSGSPLSHIIFKRPKS